MPQQGIGSCRLLDRWIEAISRRDSEAVAGLYDPEAQLWGTLAAQLRTDPDAFADYFRRFLACDCMRAELGDVELRTLTDGLVLAAGDYRFFWKNASDREETQARARFTMVLGEREGSWRILQHHSSEWLGDGF